MKVLFKPIGAALTWYNGRLTNPATALPAAGALTLIAAVLQVLLPSNGFAILLSLLAVMAASAAAIRPLYKWGLAAVILVGVLPYAGTENPALAPLMVQMFIYIALALGLNLVVGFAGLLDLGYIAFFAGGAYVYAIFASNQAAKFSDWFAENAPMGLGGWWFWAALPLAIGVAALLGLMLGLPVLRMRGDYLAIVTLGFGEVIQVISRNLDHPVNITGGAPGIAPINPPSLGPINLGSPTGIYFLGLIFTVLVGLAMTRLEQSRLGRAWAAMREDDIAARAMGVPLVKMKLMAFATGASFSGAMGMLFAIKQQFINPDTFGFMESIGILAMIILGGLGSIRGVIVGAAAVTLLRFQFLRDLSDYFATWGLPPAIDVTKYQPLLFGLILIVMMIFKQEGLVPATRPTVDIAELERTVPPSRKGATVAR